MMPSKRAFLTVDYEDYNRISLRDGLGEDRGPWVQEVVRPTKILQELFAEIQAKATFFSVGQLAEDLPQHLWHELARDHDLGCHSYAHERVDRQGPDAFRKDIRRAKATLEEAAGVEITSFRAPYFSCDHCDPWFGRVLAEEGFTLDSSIRIPFETDLGAHTHLKGSEGRVREVPLPSIGIGSKRLTIIGGTYFRVLPSRVIRGLLDRAEQAGFTPMIYLHPYDLDPKAEPLPYTRRQRYLKRAGWGDRLRRLGRETAADKLRALAKTYSFVPVG